MNKNDLKESDLYLSIKKHFINQGFIVRGEVLNCDLVGVKKDEVIIVEMKKNFSLELLYQGLDRFKYSGAVYVAIPKYEKSQQRKKEIKMKKILKRLDLGLIYVYIQKPKMPIEIILEPQLKEKNNRYKRSLLKEFNQRSFDGNIGGINNKKVLTAYRENAVKIACVLGDKGAMTSAKLISLYGCCEKTYTILYTNRYNWFVRLGNGIYDLSEIGVKEIDYKEYLPLINLYRNNGGK